MSLVSRVPIESMQILRTHHITYATAQYTSSARLLVRTARKYGLTTRSYGPSDPAVTALVHRFPQIMAAARGGGYWLWKPFIIRDAMRNSADGDAILYSDCAMVFVADPAPLLALSRNYPIVLFEMSSGQLEKDWTKRDCFLILNADEPIFWNVPQLWGGVQLYRVGPEARAFIDVLCEAMSDAHVLTDLPNIHGLPDLPGFRAHRHDQSVLTILARKFAVPFFPDPSQWGLRVPRLQPLVLADGIERPAAPYGQVLHVHRKKNDAMLFWYARHLLKRLVGRRTLHLPAIGGGS